MPATAIDVQAGQATCVGCKRTFPCQDQLDDCLLQASLRQPDVPLPAGMHLGLCRGGLEISRRWLSARAVYLLLFASVWDACLIIWYRIALSKGLGPIATFGALHAAIGLGISYAAVAGLLNTTVITVSQGLLQIRHGPLPWPGNRCLAVRELVQPYTKRLVHHSKHGTYTSYQVRAMTRGGKDLKLVGVEREQQALFIEQRLERYLGDSGGTGSGTLERG